MVQRVKIASLSWNLVPRIFQICKVWCLINLPVVYSQRLEANGFSGDLLKKKHIDLFNNLEINLLIHFKLLTEESVTPFSVIQKHNPRMVGKLKKWNTAWTYFFSRVMKHQNAFLRASMLQTGMKRLSKNQTIFHWFIYQILYCPCKKMLFSCCCVTVRYCPLWINFLHYFEVTTLLSLPYEALYKPISLHAFSFCTKREPFPLPIHGYMIWFFVNYTLFLKGSFLE